MPGRCVASAVVACLLSASPAQAQDAFGSIGDAAISMGDATLRQVQMNIIQPRRVLAPKGARSSAAGVSTRAKRGASFRYSPTSVLSQQAAQAVIGRLRSTNRAAAEALGREVSRHDFASIYRGLVRPFGLRDDDAADVVAAYTALGWIIANGAADPSPTAVRSLREQISLGLTADARISSPAARARLGEEMKVLFVALHAGWQSARREGPQSLERYGDGVAQMWRAQGTDLRNVVLTGTGFTAR